MLLLGRQAHRLASGTAPEVFYERVQGSSKESSLNTDIPFLKVIRISAQLVPHAQVNCFFNETIQNLGNVLCGRQVLSFETSLPMPLGILYNSVLVAVRNRSYPLAIHLMRKVEAMLNTELFDSYYSKDRFKTG